MPTAKEIFSEADKLFNEDRLAEASSLYLILINGGIEDRSVLFNRAICESQLGNYEEAFIASNLVLKRYPELDTMLFIRAIASWNLNNFNAANADFEKALELGNTMAAKNFESFTEEETIYNLKMFDAYKNDTVAVDLSNVFFISNQHKRFENNKQISHNLDCERAIRIVQNVDNKELYEVTIFSLQKPHPIWKSYITMVPKRMKISERTRILTKLDGFGVDLTGEPFSNYSLTINHGLTDIQSLILHLNDRNTYVLYENL